MSEEKTTEQQIEEFEHLLSQQEDEMVRLRDERSSIVRKLRKAKLKLVAPSEVVLKLARTAGPLDDVFFTKLAEDIATIEEIVSTVLNVPVKVKSTIPQFTITNIGSRGVRLDSFAEIIVEAELQEDCVWGKKGAFVDVEVQKENVGDHEYRVFYNGASMVIDKTPKNTNFADLARAIVIYISAFDVFKEGKVFYETVKVDKESKNPRRSPVSEFYVNTENLDAAANDQDERIRRVSALMKVFRDPDWYDEQMFPAFSKRKKELHETEKGVEDVSREMQLIIDEEVKKAEQKAEEREVASIRSLKEKMKLTTQEAMDAMSIPTDRQARYAQMV